MRRPRQMKPAVVAALCLCLIGLGCAKTLYVAIPDGFHGHVILQCGLLTTEGDSSLKIPESGRLDDIKCPAHQGKLLVTNSAGKPLEVHDKWVTTGDGPVRGIIFDIQ